MKAQVFAIMEGPINASREARLFNGAMTLLIALNVLAIILETVPSLRADYSTLFHGFELFSIAVFSAEYLARLWVNTCDERFSWPVLGRIRWAVTPMALIDLLAIAPFFLALLFPVHLGVTRALRFVRLMRLLKLTRYARPLQTLGTVLQDRRDQLVICLFIVLILLLFTSSTVYLVEHPAQPEAFSSIPASMWWGVATLTTVGYGDVYPVTTLGRIMGGIIAILGVGIFALPAGILASGFAEELDRQRNRRERVCPHCGGALEDD